MKGNERFIKISIGITAIIAFAFFLYAISIASKAVYDSIFILFILTIAYIYHKRLNIKPYSIALAGIFFVFHMLGTIGWYDLAVFGIQYDKILHFYGPFVLFIITFNYLSKFDLGLGYRLGFALFITLGIDAMQEIVEFTGNTLLGRGEGLFFYGAGDIGGADTPRDLIANLFGNLLGLTVMFFKEKISK